MRTDDKSKNSNPSLRTPSIDHAAIEALEQQEVKVDIIYTMVVTVLVILGIFCIILLVALQQMWIGLIGVGVWLSSFAARAIWAQVKENIHTKILEAEKELSKKR